jgi:uncharacterized protein YndB with AHSA1/START domain
MSMSLVVEKEIFISKPASLVFSAWTSEKMVASWFGPNTIKSPDVEWDFRPSGRYSVRWFLDNGVIFTTEGVFQTILPNDKIVMTWRCDAFPDPTTVVSITFTEEHGGTCVKIRHENFELPDTCANHTQGWLLCLSQLKDLMEA